LKSMVILMNLEAYEKDGEGKRMNELGLFWDLAMNRFKE
jgi:hypothetical protein